MLMEYFDTYCTHHRPYKGGAWCYEDGLIYRALGMLHKATNEARWLDHLTRLVDAQIHDGPTLAGYDPNAYNIDNIFAGRALLFLEEVTGDKRYLDAAALLVGQLKTQPRTQTGVYWHKLRYPWQVWLDGLYMGLPFQIGYGQRTGDAALVEDALRQVNTALDMAYVPQTGLYAHAVDEAKRQNWADSQTGHSSAHWARALGWLAMVLVDIRDLVGPILFDPLEVRTRALLSNIAELKTPAGQWLQVIDQPDLDGNFEESSASAMFIYAMLRAKSFGLYDGDTGSLLDQLVEAVFQRSTSGQMEMTGICHVAGLGDYQGRYRDGTAGYYISETLAADDPKGVAPLMMAFAIQHAMLATSVAEPA